MKNLNVSFVLAALIAANGFVSAFPIVLPASLQPPSPPTNEPSSAAVANLHRRDDTDPLHIGLLYTTVVNTMQSNNATSTNPSSPPNSGGSPGSGSPDPSAGGTPNVAQRSYDGLDDIEARDYWDDSDIEARDYLDMDIDELQARDYADIEDIEARDYADVYDLEARDFTDMEDLEARDFTDMEDLEARDYTNLEDFEARDLSDDLEARNYWESGLERRGGLDGDDEELEFFARDLFDDDELLYAREFDDVELEARDY